MKTKCIEIRDEGTCIAALAIQMDAANPVEYRFLRREGYPMDGHGIVLMKLSDQKATSDSYAWDNRTMCAAHNWIEAQWSKLKDGDVVDVRVVLGMTTIPATPEIWIR